MSDTPRKPSLNKLSLKRETATDQPKLEERLHKVLAQAGLGSRRALEQRIADGLVKVNGEVAQTGQSIKSGDKVELDGRGFVATALTETSRVLAYNKPEGEVTTREDPEGRPTVFEALPALKGARWIAIGRLDINTTGLLLATTDGELANAMMHPSYEVEREYVVRVRAPEGEEKVPDNIVDRLARGVALEDGPAKFDEIERIGTHLAELLDAGVDLQGQPYLALAYVEGEPITDYCQRLQLPLERRLQLMLQVCAVVSHAHANLIVHRDLKPSNILVTAEGEVKLLDFGIAKLLDDQDGRDPAQHPPTEARAFTLHYAAPEQVRGEPVTTLTDVYSLGVVLFEVITGRKPYRLRRQSDAEWERSILEVDAQQHGRSPRRIHRAL